MAGADGHLKERLDDAFVVNQEVYVVLVNDVVMRGKPRQGALEGCQFSIKGRGGEDPVRMFSDGGASAGDDGGVGTALV